MSDRLAAQIWIGGKITKTDFVKLFLVARDSGVGFEWGENPIGSNPQEFMDSIDFTEPLYLCDIDACYGEFPDLTSFCQKHKLTYKVQNEAKYEYNAEVEWWKPGMKSCKTCRSDQDGNFLVDVKELHKIMKTGTYAQKVKKVQDFLDSNFPCEVPPLKIVDDGFDMEKWTEVDID